MNKKVSGRLKRVKYKKENPVCPFDHSSETDPTHAVKYEFPCEIGVGGMVPCFALTVKDNKDRHWNWDDRTLVLNGPDDRIIQEWSLK